MLVDREERLKDLSRVPRHLALYADFEPFYQKCSLENCPSTWEAILEIVQHFPANHFEAYEATSKICRQLPPAPFITSTIQQDAHTMLGLSPLQCMSVLQSLYEKGRITYMRTDSPTLSPSFLKTCEDYIVQKYGATLYESRQYDSSKTSQDAHEAIRPTKIKVETLPEGCTDLEKKMYARIWKRAVASQMVAHRYTETVTRIRNGPYRFRHVCTTTLQKGWKTLYGWEESVPQQPPPLLPSPLTWKGGRVTEEWDKTQGRHSEASLVREMEKRGIGRPSTFASLGAKLLERNYATVGSVPGISVPKKQLFIDQNFQLRESHETIVVGEESKKYRVTPVGHQVMNYLKETFPLVLDYSMTESMENDLDTIAREGSHYYTMLSRWLSQFSWEKNK
jgi:DNA topoisomerase-1